MKAIMVGVDGSAHSEVAVRYAVEIADLAGATVVGLASVAADYQGEVPAEEHRAEEREALKALPRTVIEWFQKALDECAETCATADVRFTATMLAGEPGQVIADEAQACDMVVLGARGRRAHGLDLLGDTAQRVIRTCIKPVLVVREQYKPIARVLVGYDGSPASGHAVEWAADLAAAGNWQVVLVTGAPSRSSLAEGADYAARLIQTRGVNPEVVLVRGDAPSIIFEQAKEHEPDLIAVGGPQRGTVSGFFLGEAWPDIVEQADVPVLRWR
ncbi:MAG: universal stress protein [Armatimonadota bacterium]